MSIQFTLSDTQEAKYKAWHCKKCKYYDQSLGVRNAGLGCNTDKFIFLPTMFGDIVTVECVCGKKLDLTENFG